MMLLHSEVDNVTAFVQARCLACLVTMMAFTDAGGDFRRELAVYTGVWVPKIGVD